MDKAIDNTKIARYLHMFHDAVLTGIDARGYPVSIRCKPELDETEQVLRVQLPPGIQIEAGQANILCHSHDEKLQHHHLKSFALQGTLERQGDSWHFHIQRLLPGMNMAGAPGPIATITNTRRTMKQILQKRGLQQPEIPWEQFKELARAEQDA
jgi:hypothetical protein